MENREAARDLKYWSQLEREWPREMRRLERSNDTRYSYLQLFLMAAAVISISVAISLFTPSTNFEVIQQTTATDLVVFPSGEVEFIVGPQLRSGSARNIAPWFDGNAVSRGLVLGAEFPATPPPFDPASGDAMDAYVNLNYYDQALCQYTNYYRTGAARFLDAARKIADSWWSSHAIDSGNRNVEDSMAPRNVSLSGLMLRAMDGRPEMWPWITNYTRQMFQMWVGARVQYPGLYYGVRDGGYMLLYAANLARVHPDASVRAEFRQKALDAAVNYYARLQQADGSWRWDDPDLSPPLFGYSQPFHVGLLLEGMIAVHRLTGDATVGQAILRGTENLYTYHFDRNPFVLDGSQGTWRAMIYIGYKDWNNEPFAPGEQYRTQNPAGFNEVREARQLNSTTHHAFGYAYFISGEERFRTWGDEIFRASFNALDGYRNLADFRAKEYNQNYRASGRYLAWRLGPTGSSAPPLTPRIGQVPHRVPLLSAQSQQAAGPASLNLVSTALTEAVNISTSAALSEERVRSLAATIEEIRRLFVAEQNQFIAPNDALSELQAASEHVRTALIIVREGGGFKDAKLRVGWAAARLRRARDQMRLPSGRP